MNRILVAPVAASLCALLTVAGCTADSAPSLSEDSMVVGTEGNPLSWDASIAEKYDSLDAAARQATLVIEGVAGRSRVETISGVPFTVTNVQIVSVIDGSPTAKAVGIRQFGDINNRDAAFADRLEPNQKYLLFVEPFEFERGVPTDQWVIVGGVAAWRYDDSGTYRSTSNSDLPSVLTATELSSLGAKATG